MSRAVTNDETGQRSYHDLPLDPPRPVRSVTSILSAGTPKPALINAAGKVNRERTCDVAHDLALEYVAAGNDFGEFGFSLWQAVEKRAFHNEAWKKKASVGAVVHYAIERDIKLALGLVAPALPWDETPDYAELPEEHRVMCHDAVRSWDAFREEAAFEPLASEEVVWIAGARHSHDGCADKVWVGYPVPVMQHDCAARLDVLAVVGGRRMVLDVKTGSGVYPEHWLQVEFQRRASNVRELCGGKFVSAGILHVPASGGSVRLYDQEGTGLTAAERKKYGLPRDRDRDLEALDYAAGIAEWSLGVAK